MCVCNLQRGCGLPPPPPPILLMAQPPLNHLINLMSILSREFINHPAQLGCVGHCALYMTPTWCRLSFISLLVLILMIHKNIYKFIARARVSLVWAPDPSISHARNPHNRMRVFRMCLYKEGLDPRLPIFRHPYK